MLVQREMYILLPQSAIWTVVCEGEILKDKYIFSWEVVIWSAHSSEKEALLLLRSLEKGCGHM